MACTFIPEISQLDRFQHSANHNSSFNLYPYHNSNIDGAQMAPRPDRRNLVQDRPRNIITASQNNQQRGHQNRQQTQRRRTQVACARCRKRKIKCSGDPGNGMGCNNCRHSGRDVAKLCFFARVQATEVAWLLGAQNQANSLSLDSESPTIQTQAVLPSVYAYEAIPNTSGTSFESHLSRQSPYAFTWRPPISGDQTGSSALPLPYPSTGESYNIPSTSNNLPPLDVHLHFGNPARPAPYHNFLSTRNMNGSVDGGIPFGFSAQSSSIPSGSPLVDRQLPAPATYRPHSEASAQPLNYRGSLLWSTDGTTSSASRHYIPNAAEYGTSTRSNSAVVSGYIGHHQTFAPSFAFPFGGHVTSPPVAPSSSASSSFSTCGGTAISPRVCSAQTNGAQHIPASSFSLPSLTPQFGILGDPERHDESLNEYSFNVNQSRSSIDHSSPHEPQYGTLINGQQYIPLNEDPSDQRSGRQLMQMRSQELMRRGSQRIGS